MNDATREVGGTLGVAIIGSGNADAAQSLTDAENSAFLGGLAAGS